MSTLAPPKAAARLRPKPSVSGALGSRILQRKCACGGTPGLDGECAQCRAKRLRVQRSARGTSMPPVQAKLSVSQPGDRFEQEADRVASQVLAMSGGIPGGPVGVSSVASSSWAMPAGGYARLEAAGAELETGLMGLERGGRPLPEPVRADLEPRFGHDFGGVRVRTDAQAAAMAEWMQARAFTLGRTIVFAPGEYAPDTARGRFLLAHELTHVLQQTGGGTPGVGGARVTPTQLSPQPYIARANCSTLSRRSCNGVFSCGYGGSGKCWWGGITRGCVCMGSAQRTAEAEAWVRENIPAIILTLLSAAAIALIVACFASGVCEAAALIGAAGATAAAVIIAILEGAGVDVRGETA